MKRSELVKKVQVLEAQLSELRAALDRFPSGQLIWGLLDDGFVLGPDLAYIESIRDEEEGSFLFTFKCGTPRSAALEHLQGMEQMLLTSDTFSIFPEPSAEGPKEDGPFPYDPAAETPFF